MSAIKALERHLWYLTGEMLPLALFNIKLPAAEQRALADAILQNKPDILPMRAPEQRFETGFGKPMFPVLSPTTRLADLANADCLFGMHQLQIDPGFSQRRRFGYHFIVPGRLGACTCHQCGK